MSAVFWEKPQKTLKLYFNVWIAKNFSGGDFDCLWNSNIESQAVTIQHCYSEFLSLMFSSGSVWTKRHDSEIPTFTQTFDAMFQFNDEGFSAVG